MLGHKYSSKTHLKAYSRFLEREWGSASNEEHSYDELHRPRARLNAQLAMGCSSCGGCPLRRDQPRSPEFLFSLVKTLLLTKHLKNFWKKYSKQNEKRTGYSKKTHTGTSLKQKHTKAILSKNTKY
jgi:hypothetical protein